MIGDLPAWALLVAPLLVIWCARTDGRRRDS